MNRVGWMAYGKSGQADARVLSVAPGVVDVRRAWA